MANNMYSTMPRGINYFSEYFNAIDMFSPRYDDKGKWVYKQINGQDISPEIKMGNFATTAHPGKDPLEELNSKIKEGATALELGFTGQGKGNVSGGQTTPGSFSEDERWAIQRLAQENKVKLSTHASITLTGFSGLTRDQETYGWKFDDTKRVEAEKEAEQTIDFAADTAKGGAIVIHAGEFFRDIINSPNNFEKSPDEKAYFESYTGEKKKIMDVANQSLEGVDDSEKKDTFHFQLGKVARADTGEIEKVHRDLPILMKKEQWAALSEDVKKMNEEITKIQKSQMSREEKNSKIEKIKEDIEENMNKHILEFEQLYKEEKSEELKNKELKQSIYKKTEEGKKSEIDVGKGKTIEKVEYAKVLKMMGFDYGEADKLFHRLRLSQTYNSKAADIEMYHARYNEARKDLVDLKEAYTIQKEIEKDTPDEKRALLKRKTMRQRAYDMGLIPDEYEYPTKFLEDQIKQKEEELKHLESYLMNMQQELTMFENQIGSITKTGNLRSISELGLEKTAETISALGLHAMQKWQIDLEGKDGEKIDREKLNQLAIAHGINDFEKMNTEELKKKVDEHALYVAPENMMPDFGPTGEPAYGGHPQELKEIILKAREAMVEKLTDPKNHGIRLTDYGFDNSKEKLDKKEAEELAARHIKATFDIGHANVWRKFFHGVEPQKADGKTEDEQFKDWLHSQVKDLLDSNIIGHVHITDNFGYADDHISPGEGGKKRGAPIGDFTKLVLEAEKKGKKPLEPWIVEAGHQGTNVLFNAWHNFGHPIYRLGTGLPGPSFGFAEQSYLTSSYSSKLFNEGTLGPGQNRQVGWSGSPLI